MQTLCAVLCALFVLGLLHAERTRNRRLKLVCKPLASLAFLILGSYNLVRGAPPKPIDLWIFAGLALGAAGDVCLMLPGSRWFLAGLSSFLLGHVAYTAGFFSEVSPSAALLFPALLGGLLVGLILRAWWPFIRDKRVPVIAYACTIVVMVTAAASLVRAEIPRGGWIFAAAALFAVSDVAVVRERFVAPGFVNKAWGLPLYYAAQLLLAACVGVRARG